MGGAIYFRDANGNVVQAGEENPLPVGQVDSQPEE